MNPVLLRVIVLTVCIAPYLYFGISDVLHHKQHRPVVFTEKLLHVSLGMMLTIIIPHAYMGHFEVVVPGLFLFVAMRAVDEFVFHRGLAPEEVDLHAKTHFGFLIYVTGVMGMAWLQKQTNWS